MVAVGLQPGFIDQPSDPFSGPDVTGLVAPEGAEVCHLLCVKVGMLG